MKRCRRAPLSGDVPSSLRPPPGCRFHPRGPFAEPVCTVTPPSLRDVGPARRAVCHFAERAETWGAEAPATVTERP